jgi:hypothetical protein
MKERKMNQGQRELQHRAATKKTEKEKRTWRTG